MTTEVVNENLVRIHYDGGRVVSVSSDDGTAVLLATSLLDWSDMFRREDEANEITQILEVA